jgi:hypothetical protein
MTGLDNVSFDLTIFSFASYMMAGACYVVARIFVYLADGQRVNMENWRGHPTQNLT